MKTFIKQQTNNKSMNRATVKEPIIFTGDSPDSRLFRLISKNWMTRPTSMIIKQPENPGMYWKIGEKGKEHPIDIFHTYAETNYTGARYIFFSDQKDDDLSNISPTKGEKAFIVEHILSALNYSKITDATIQLEPALFSKKIAHAPIIGSGITELVDKLQEQKIELNEKATILEVTKTKTKIIQNKRGTHFMSVEPSDNLEMYINNSDLGKINIQSKDIHLKNVYEELNTIARPVARLDTSLKVKGLNWLNSRGYKGVSEETYIVANKYCTNKEFIKKMHKEFQEGANEQLWHGIIDRSGELFAIQGMPIKGKFMYSSANHLSAIESLKYFYKEGCFVTKNL